MDTMELPARAAALLPPGSCDSQFHVYGDRALYPVRHDNPLYEAPFAPLARATAMHAALGFERVVLVQATVYKTDHSLLLDSLTQLTTARARGIAIIDDNVSDDYLERLHRAGVRAARFNFQKRLGVVPSLETFHRQVARVRELGWFIKIFAGPNELPELVPEIAKCDLPVVFDHMGHLNFGLGVDQPAMKLLCGILAQDNRWLMLSNGHRGSQLGAPWDDAVPFGLKFYETAPERVIWGSDWPHIGSRGGPMPDDGELVKLALRYLPDAAAVERVFVKNPARLFGF